MSSELIEISEAIKAGEDLLDISDKVLNSLNDAKLWGIFDMFSDHGLISGLIKHSKLDDAQNMLGELKYVLTRFNDELDDVKVYDNVSQISFDGFVRIFDIFFDNFFVDIYALSRIRDSKNQILQLQDEVRKVLNDLRSIKA